MPKKYYLHPAFGEITLNKNRLSKGLRIIVKPTNSITVTFPWHVSYNFAIEFLQSKTDWIERTLKKNASTQSLKLFLPDSSFRTFAHELRFQKISSGNPYIKVDKYNITVFFFDEQSVRTDEMQALIKKAIERVLRNEALSYLPSRVEFFANKHNLSYSRISVKKMKTRWGSCSSNGNLNFNIHLMRLPIHLIDYVILHELAHTVHHNHGKNFWKLLEELAGGAKEKSNEMKSFRTTL